MEDLAAYKCTCEGTDDAFEHETSCCLYDCWAFEIGVAYWDPDDRMLYYCDEQEMNDTLHTMKASLHDAAEDSIGGPISDGYPLYTTADLDADIPVDEPPEGHIVGGDKRLYHTSFPDDETLRNIVTVKVEDWLNASVDGEPDAPNNFTYRGCTWVWDRTRAQWEPKKIGCHCGADVLDPDILACVVCEVDRVGRFAKWRAAMLRPNEVTCDCPEPKAWTCVSCDVRRVEEWNPWEKGSTTPLNKPIGPKAVGGATSSNWSSGTKYEYTSYQKCRHYAQEVVFPNDVKVWASSYFSRKTDDEALPDIGFYLDSIWTPQCLAFYVPWADMGLPRITWNRVVEGIHAIYKMAQQGSIVEIGCIGGHGRTGTVLGCLAVLSGVPAGEAVKWVHDNYCEEAVESARQEWFILWFDCFEKGIDPPEMPTASAFGQKVKDKEKNKGKDVKLVRDTTGQLYCQGCMTDCKEHPDDEGLPVWCWWCSGTFAEYKAPPPKAIQPHLSPADKATKAKGALKGDPKANSL